MKKIYLPLLLCSFLYAEAGHENNEQLSDTMQKKQTTLIGRSSIGLGIGTTQYKDVAIKDELSYSLFGSYAIDKNIVVGVDFDYETANYDDSQSDVEGDVAAKAIAMNAMYHFLPDDTIDPYISISMFNVKSDVDITNTVTHQNATQNDSDNGYSISLGLEYDIQDDLFAVPTLSYGKLGDYDANTVTGLGLYYLYESIAFGGGATYNINDKDISYGVKVGYIF